MKRRVVPGQVAAFISMFVVCILWVTPLVYGIFTTFKSEVEIKAVNFHFIPEKWVFDNYINVLKNTGNTPVVRWFFNSVIISGCTCILVVFIVSLAAYGYARLRWKNQDRFFYTLLALSLFPQIVNIIPLYKIMSVLDWVNTMWAVIIPALGGVVNVFLVRQFMLGIPRDFDEAARIDGTGEFSIYFYIILPMVKPILTVVALFSFTGQWNDLLWPAIVFNDVKKIPLTPGLQLLMGSYGNFFFGAIMTGAILAVLPTFVLFIFTQKYFMQSLSLSSGIKG
jgi:multiple sugar transport system permease protein